MQRIICALYTFLLTVKINPNTFHFFSNYTFFQFSSVQLLSHVQLFVTPWTTAHQASLFIANAQSLLKFMSIESVMPSNHLTLFHPLLLPPSAVPSIRVFSNESVLHIRWPKYWSFSFSISPSNKYSGLISFRVFNITLTRIVKMGTLVLFLMLKRKHCFILKFDIFCRLF